MRHRAAALVLVLLAAGGLRAEDKPAPPPPPPPPPTDTGLIPRLNLYLPEGQADIRLSKLVKNSLFETQFDYDFVSGDIAAFLRYKYYGARQSVSVSAFDSVSFRAIETFSNDFDRTRGFNILVRRPVGNKRRLFLLTEFDRLTFSSLNKDNNRSNLFMKLGYQLGTEGDSRSNQVSGDKTDRIRNLFTVYRDIGPNGRGLSLALTYGVPIASFNYLKAEGEALQVIDLPKNRRLVGRIHVGFFPYKGTTDPAESSAGKPYRIPGGELFRLDGRENLKGSKSGDRGVNEIHLTLEGFTPIFRNKNANFLKVTWNTLYAVGYIGTGNLGDETRIFTKFGDWKQDVGLGAEVSFSYRNYQVFVSGLVARVIQEPGSPKFLFTLRSVN